MRYRQKVKVSENFPTEKGDAWRVLERGKLAETWHVLHKAKTYFIAEVHEHFPIGD